jgi:hypothetical protein
MLTKAQASNHYYTILLPEKFEDVCNKLEDSYKKIVTNNSLNKPIKLISHNGIEYKFNLPIELRAFILGLSFKKD